MKNPKCIENLRHMLRSLGNIKNQWKFRNLAKMFTKGQKLLKGIEILDKWRTKCFLIENNPKTSQICDILRNMLKNPKSIKNLQNMMQNPINCENRWKCQNLPTMLTKIWKMKKKCCKSSSYVTICGFSKILSKMQTNFGNVQEKPEKPLKMLLHCWNI